MAGRNYLESTIKILFGLSGNQCAHPDCNVRIIMPSTDKSDPIVLSQICHIYAFSDNGPRGKEGLTEKEINSPENLILLCPTHHVIIDKQHETYPAEILKQWKKQHEDDVIKKMSLDLNNIQPDIFSYSYFPTELVNMKINGDLENIRKCRFYTEYSEGNASSILAQKITNGELAGGSTAVKSKALAWCARLLVNTDLIEAENYLVKAERLGNCPDTEIARAFVYSRKDDPQSALSILAKIDSPMSKSAALMVKSYKEDPQAAINWLQDSKIDKKDLDSEGRFYLLSLYLELSKWDDAFECLDSLCDKDFENTPALHHLVALTYLISTTPYEMPAVILSQLPFELRNFRLSSDSSAIDARRKAHFHFIKASETALKYNCSEVANVDDEYALWMELRDPNEYEKGILRLEVKLREPKSALRFVNFGLQFNIKLDLEAIESEIERQISLHGGITKDAALARFALAFTKKSPEEAANYISKYQDELSPFLDKKIMQIMQIELLCEAGLSERANKCFNILMLEGISNEEEQFLNGLIVETEWSNPITERKKQFKLTNSQRDLIMLVNELDHGEDWNGLGEYSEILYNRTHSVQDAELLIKALSNTNNNNKIVEFLKNKPDLRKLSNNLQIIFCWAMYNEGLLLEVQSELTNSDLKKDSDFRALEINLAISLGDWNSLNSYVANECSAKDNRSAKELIKSAQLAFNIGSSSAKELTFAAAKIGKADPEILSSAYFLATNAGWEDNEEVSRWLSEAAEQSTEEGPIKKFTLKDLFDMKPKWDNQEAKIWELLRNGEIPMFIAAESLNRSLVNMILYPAFANTLEKDPRRRGIVPVYSGNHKSSKLDVNSIIGIDATALLTLSYLNILEIVVNSFKEIYIPHTTLLWLFQEKQKATFHQPSRYREAHKMQNLLATGAVEKLKPTTNANNYLSELVGEDLAQLITEAENGRNTSDIQHLVIRPYPVTRITSFLEEDADLSSYNGLMSSCQAIVGKLWEKGKITTDEKKRMIFYLSIHEKEWPNQPAINDKATLFMDGISIHYFAQLGILEKIRDAGFTIVISSREYDEVNNLIAYEGISDGINNLIEKIRDILCSGIQNKKIKVGKKTIVERDEDNGSTIDHPTIGIIDLANNCDGILVDDRFLNQHGLVESHEKKTPIYTTLDLIDSLFVEGKISNEVMFEYRTLLRYANFCFMPMNDDELNYHLEVSNIKDGRVIETAELKAIRENILKIRMSNWLQYPKESEWFDSLINTFSRSLKLQWQNGSDFSISKSRSNWIIEQIDICYWVQQVKNENINNFFNLCYSDFVKSLIALSLDMPDNVKLEYWNWLDERLIIPIKNQNPSLYSIIINWYTSNVRNIIGRFVSNEEGTSDGK